MFYNKFISYSTLHVLTFVLIYTFSAANAFDASVTLSKRVFQKQRDSVEVQLFTGSNTTLYDALLEAARVNDNFRFTGIRYSFGYYIDSIGGLAENSNKSLNWFVYKKTSLGEEVLQSGVSSTIVADNEHYLFWYKKSSHSKNISVTNPNFCALCYNSVTEIDPPLYKRIWSVVESIYDYFTNIF